MKDLPPPAANDDNLEFDEGGAKEALHEKLGPSAIYNLARIAFDPKQPTGARVKASEILVKASGIAVQAGASDKELHEMTGDELRQQITRMEAQQQAMQRALADQARPVVEGNVFD